MAEEEKTENSENSKGWPEGYFDLYGCSPDFPEVEDLEPEPIESW